MNELGRRPARALDESPVVDSWGCIPSKCAGRTKLPCCGDAAAAVLGVCGVRTLTPNVTVERVVASVRSKPMLPLRWDSEEGLAAIRDEE